MGDDFRALFSCMKNLAKHRITLTQTSSFLFFNKIPNITFSLEIDWKVEIFCFIHLWISTQNLLVILHEKNTRSVISVSFLQNKHILSSMLNRNFNNSLEGYMLFIILKSVFCFRGYGKFQIHSSELNNWLFIEFVQNVIFVIFIRESFFSEILSNKIIVAFFIKSEITLDWQQSQLWLYRLMCHCVFG